MSLRASLLQRQFYQPTALDTKFQLGKRTRDDETKTDSSSTVDEISSEPVAKRQRSRLPAWLNVTPRKDRKDLIPTNPHAEHGGKHPFRTMISGSSGSGKTTLVRHLYDHFWADYFDKIYIWSPSYHLDDTWRDLRVKPTKAFTKWDGNQYLKILHDNAKIVENKGVDRAPKILQIVDDFAADKKAARHPSLREVAFNSRHANHSSVWLSQSYVRYDSDMRKNLSMLFAFRPSNEKETVALTDEQTIPLLSRAQFREILNDATRDPYSFLVVNHQTADARDTYRKGLNDVLRIDPERATAMATMRNSRLRQTAQQTSATPSQPQPSFSQNTTLP